MSSNIAVSISADVTGLTAKLAVAKADLSATTAELRNMAAQMREAGSSASDALKSGLTQAASAAASAQSKVSGLRAQIQAAKPATEELSGAYEHQSQIIREKLILAHEGLMGNYKRMVGSIVVLSERTGGLGGALATLVTPTTLAIAAVGGLLPPPLSALLWSPSDGVNPSAKSRPPWTRPAPASARAKARSRPISTIFASFTA